MLQLNRQIIRRLAWVANNLFWNQFIPIASGVTTKVCTDAVRSSLPKTSSPFLSGHLLRTQTADGAVLASMVPVRAWAKYALPKGLPAEGGRVLAIENDPHFADDFDGEISSGYGKGVKSLLLSDPVILKVGGRTSIQKINYHVHEADRAGKHFDLVVTGVEPGVDQWEMNIPRGIFKGRYAYVKTGNAAIIVRMKDQGVQLAKPDYTLRNDERLANVDLTESIVERKIDGSLGNAHIQGQRAAFRSHREGGETYYDRLPSVEFLNNESSFVTSRLLYPGPALSGTVFQGELTHPDGAARVSGILNSLPQNARAIQIQRGPVRYFVWDILKYKNKDVSRLPYGERRALCESLVNEIRRVNKSWDIVEKLEGNETPQQFYERVTRDPLPWGEGVVVKLRDQQLQKWDKIKMTGFGYFKLVDVLPGEGKYANSVGRLRVASPENGAEGEVGSLAVPDEFRDWMWRNRNTLRGQTVKVRSQAITARGVPRAGVFYGFHDGEVDLLMQAESMAGGDAKEANRIKYAMKSAVGWRPK